MASTVTETQSFPNSLPSKMQEKGSLKGREVIPAAHFGGADASQWCSGALAILMTLGAFIAGAVLWGLGAAPGGDPGMLIAGQVLTGLQLGCVGLMLLVASCLGCCMCCGCKIPQDG